MRKFVVIAILLILNILSTAGLSEYIREEDPAIYLTQSFGMFLPVSRDFHNFFANIGFINTMAFIGKKSEEKRKISGGEGKIIYNSLNTSSLLNPTYFDIYYVSNAFLTWEVGLYEEANTILERGLQYVKDWKIPFYLGFNYYFFIGDNKKGAEYIYLASKYPEARNYNLLPLLASRLYYEENQIDLAIVIVSGQLREIKDEKLQKALISRLQSLQKIKLIYYAMHLFEKKFGRRPNNIEELVKAGLIPPDMRDSRGGKFYITKEGKVRSEKEFKFLHTLDNYKGKGIDDN